MKLVRDILIAGVLLALWVVGSSAEEPVWTVKVEMLMVSVPPSTSLSLLPKLRDEKSTAAAIEELWRWIEGGDAELLGYPIAMVGNGGRSVAETVEYVRYPTEEDWDRSGTAMNYDALNYLRPFPRDWRSIYSKLGWGPITPLGFEDRNVGEKLEVEAAVKKGDDRIQLSVTAECVRVLRFKEFAGMEALNGVTGVAVRPEFASFRFTSSLTARSGEWMLFSSFVQPQPRPHVILFLLRAVSHRRGDEKLTK
ncbi:MAG: hypothetical protein EOP84_07115 [Verrucomicrobiaceae bacterium]|nr:MAG: hypothetical protein EOP84_07115 [Verrucomicrobiaceae bacterium]